MAKMIHGGMIDPRHLPPPAAQSSGKIELLERMQVTIGKIADLPQRLHAIKPATIQPIDRARRPMAIIADRFCADLELLIVDITFIDDAAHGCATRVRAQMSDTCFQEIGVQHHVAVEDIEIRPVRMLIGKLCARAATPFVAMGQLNDAHGVGARNVDRAVARSAVGQYDLAPKRRDRCYRAFQRSRDILFFVQCLDADGYGQIRLLMDGRTIRAQSRRSKNY